MVIALVAGAALNVGITWGLALLSPRLVTWQDNGGLRRLDPPAWIWAWRGFGVDGFTATRVSEGTFSVSRSAPALPRWARRQFDQLTSSHEPDALTTVESPFVGRQSCGLPWRSMWSGWRTPRRSLGTVTVDHSILLGPTMPPSQGLPLGIHWRGFVANTIVHAAVLVLIAAVLIGAVRLLRRVRGRCPRCRYRLGERMGDGCPECGWGR